MQYLSVVGSKFVACGSVISIVNGGPNTVSGNISVGTAGASVYVGAQATGLMDVGNSWDKPTPAWSEYSRGADGARVFRYNGVDQVALLPNGGGVQAVGPMGASALSISGTASLGDLNVCGTGAVMGAWIGQTVTAVPSSGTFTNVSAAVRTKRLGRKVSMSAIVYMTTIGTGAGTLMPTGLPYTQESTTYCVLTGRDQATGKAINMSLPPNSTTASVAYSDGTAPIANGLVLTASGTCETAN